MSTVEETLTKPSKTIQELIQSTHSLATMLMTSLHSMKQKGIVEKMVRVDSS